MLIPIKAEDDLHSLPWTSKKGDVIAKIDWGWRKENEMGGGQRLHGMQIKCCQM